MIIGFVTNERVIYFKEETALALELRWFETCLYKIISPPLPCLTAVGLVSD